MNSIYLQELAGGALQENAQKAIQDVIENMQDPNTPWKNKRAVMIKLTFTQDEAREDCNCDIFVEKKLAPVKPVGTKFVLGKDLETGDVFAEEYGPQVRGQLRMEDYVVDTETGEILETEKQIIDFKKAKQA